MHERIRSTTHAPHVRTLNHIHDGLVQLFAQIHVEKPGTRLGYVAGIITSDGPEKIWENIDHLEQHTHRLRAEHSWPIFSATDVFSRELFDRLDVGVAHPQEYQHFWRNVLGSGYVTDIFMTPRWEISKGAIDEFETATRLGLTTHFVDTAAHEPALHHVHSRSDTPQV